MYADKLFVIVVLALEHVIEAVDLTNPRHYAVHVANGLLRLGNCLRCEAALPKECLEFRKQIDILVLAMVEVGLKLMSNVLVAILEVVKQELQLLFPFAPEGELHLRKCLVDDACDIL